MVLRALGDFRDVPSRLLDSFVGVSRVIGVPPNHSSQEATLGHLSIENYVKLWTTRKKETKDLNLTFGVEHAKTALLDLL